jgi:hypothetical protein
MRRLYTQAYNELEKEHPNVPLPQDLISERMQEIENRNTPAPPSIWIDSGDLANAFARGYANYFLSPYNSGMPEEGPSDGQSIEYVQRVNVLREAAMLTCGYCQQSDKYGIAHRDPDQGLFCHTNYSAVWCEAQRIQESIEASK